MNCCVITQKGEECKRQGKIDGMCSYHYNKHQESGRPYQEAAVAYSNSRQSYWAKKDAAESLRLKYLGKHYHDVVLIRQTEQITWPEAKRMEEFSDYEDYEEYRFKSMDNANNYCKVVKHGIGVCGVCLNRCYVMELENHAVRCVDGDCNEYLLQVDESTLIPPKNSSTVFDH